MHLEGDTGPTIRALVHLISSAIGLCVFQMGEIIVKRWVEEFTLIQHKFLLQPCTREAPGPWRWNIGAHACRLPVISQNDTADCVEVGSCVIAVWKQKRCQPDAANLWSL